MVVSQRDKILSLQNPKIKHLVKLREKRARDQHEQYLIEGYRELLRASEGNVVFEALFVCPTLYLGTSEEELIEAIEIKGAQVFFCSPEVFKKISYRDRPDGLIGVARQTPFSLEELKLKNSAPLIVIAVEIEKPGNLGTILRSADAVGADAVFVVDHVTDIYNPNVVRASVGTLFTQPVIQVSSDVAYEWLKENGIQIVASSPEGKIRYTKADFKKPTAILVGSEQYGLSSHWFEWADQSVSIPMQGEADSLNAATSTTVLLYEILRQRTDS